MNEKANEKSWIPLIVVACASFIIVLDSLSLKCKNTTTSASCG